MNAMSKVFSGYIAGRRRWGRAQEYEASHWEHIAHRIAEKDRGQLDWYEWRAEQLRGRLAALGMDQLADGSARVLEIGSGPVGVTAFFPGSLRVAIDPLENFYADNPVLTELRDQEVRYDRGMAEDLPYEDRAFDLVIIENCIDHVSDVHAAMREIVRVLDPAGVLYLTVNCRTPWGYLVHRVLSRLRIDPGHPYTFTKGRIRALVRRYGFRITQFESKKFRERWKEYMASGDARKRIQAVLGVSHFTASLVARREPRPGKAP